jgi:hypothetical protein
MHSLLKYKGVGLTSVAKKIIMSYISEWTLQSISRPFQYRNNRFHSDIFFPDFGRHFQKDWPDANYGAPFEILLNNFKF